MYIVQKYVEPSKLNYARDMTIAYRLVDKFPLLEFWKSLPVKNRISSMVILSGEAAKKRLQYSYKEYNERLAVQKRMPDPTPEKQIILGAKVGDDYFVPPKKPKSILEFCR